MLKIISIFIDSLFPPRDTELIVRQQTSGDIKKLFSIGGYETISYTTRYHSPLVKALIKENKYHHNLQAAEHLATLLSWWLEKRVSGKVVLVPIPLGPKRLRSRGYNQVAEILKALKSPIPYTIDEPLLKRSHETPPQTSLGRQERLQNTKQGFTCDVAQLQTYHDCTIVIVDDVVTTGATLKAAQASLAPHLPPTTKLICLAIAH